MTMTNGDRDTRDIARDTDLSDADLRMLARADWHESGGALTGKDLAARYGKSPRWGQDQAAAARKETADRGKPVVAAAPRPRQTTPPPAATRQAPKPAPRGKPAADVALRRVKAAAVVLVALVAAAASYSHMHALALEAGEGQMAWVLPLSVDGLVVAATMTLLSTRKPGVLPWLALLLGLGASLAANVAAAEPTVVGRLVAAWPPVALALSFELLLRQTRRERQ